MWYFVEINDDDDNNNNDKNHLKAIRSILRAFFKSWGYLYTVLCDTFPLLTHGTLCAGPWGKVWHCPHNSGSRSQQMMKLAVYVNVHTRIILLNFFNDVTWLTPFFLFQTFLPSYGLFLIELLILGLVYSCAKSTWLIETSLYLLLKCATSM